MMSKDKTSLNGHPTAVNVRSHERPSRLKQTGKPGVLRFESYGVKVEVKTSNPGLLKSIKDFFPPGWRPSASSKIDRCYSIVTAANGNGRACSAVRTNGHRLNLLYADGCLVARSRKIDTVLDRFEADLQLFVAESAPRWVFVHSGVVRWRGQAILIPGRSFSGKTTLVAELVRAGAVYYSDEYAVLDSRGYVHPFAKPLAIRKNGSFDQTRFSVDALGGKAGVRSIPAGLIVVSQYKSGAAWHPQPLSPGKAVLELLANAVPARKKPAAALEVFQKVASTALALKGFRGDGAETARLILQRFDESR